MPNKVFFWGFLVFLGGWGGPIFFKISDPKQNDISKQCTKSQKGSSKITEVIPSQSFHVARRTNDGRLRRSSPLVPNRAVLTRRNYTPVKIGIKLTGKTSGVRVWIPFIPKPARLEVICKKLAKICIFLPKKSIKISFIIKSGLQIVFLSSMGHQEHIL